MKDSGTISHEVFSIYSKINGDSHVKLGGYDELGALGNVSGNPDFNFVRTSTRETWKMNLVQVWAFGIEGEIALPDLRYAIAETAFPYIYMPMDDFNKIAAHLNALYEREVGEVVCAKALGRCQMKDSCDKYRNVELPGGFLNMTL